MITYRIPARIWNHGLTWLWAMRGNARLEQASKLFYQFPILVFPHYFLKIWKMVVLLVLIIIIVVSGDQGPQFTSSDLTTRTSTRSHLDLLTEPLLSEAQANVSKPPVDPAYTRKLASLYIANMSLDEELGQLLMVEYNSISDLQIMVSQKHVGGVIMYQSNISTAKQTKHDTAQMQQEANFPLFIAIDQEGGNVNRLSSIYGSSLSAKQMHLSGDPNLAYREGKHTSKRMLNLGINVNFAPDVDT